MSYYILPKNNNIIDIKPTITEDGYGYFKPYISHSLHNYYYEIKKQITELSYIDKDISVNSYEEIEKIVNPYEYIFSKVPGSKYSVSKLKPSTNLFYDCLEVATTLNIFDSFKHKNINTLHISNYYADSIECLEMLRENYTDNNYYTDNNITDVFIQTLELSLIHI